MIDKRRILRQALFRYAVLALLVAAAAFLWRAEKMREPSDSPMAVSPAPTAAADERLKRETAYDRDAAALQKLLESGAADEATQALAAQTLTGLIAEHQSEIGLETALIEAGYDGAVVIVQSGAVTVMIPQDRLSESASAQILSLCLAHAQVSAENVRIMALQ